MKLITILGTRPEVIRLCQIIPKLDKFCKQIIVWTGQNFSYELSDIFFQELGVRKPDYDLNAIGTFSEQIATILVKLEKIILSERPDKFLVLGDTNSSMGAIVAKRLNVKVYHMEAGNRCYDDRSPEEINRRVIDASSDILMPYTTNSKQNLIKSGIDLNRIFVTGNPIYEVLKKYDSKTNSLSNIESLNNISIDGGYILVTLHRQENVDDKNRLSDFIESFNKLSDNYNLPVIVSTHPRLRNRMSEFNLSGMKNVHFVKPFGFIDFVALEKHASCVLTDSGTVMEECAIFNTPCCILREYHERPECQEVGACIITGCDISNIINSVNYMLSKNKNCMSYKPPQEYMNTNVSEIVTRIILSK